MTTAKPEENYYTRLIEVPNYAEKYMKKLGESKKKVQDEKPLFKMKIRRKNGPKR